MRSMSSIWCSPQMKALGPIQLTQFATCSHSTHKYGLKVAYYLPYLRIVHQRIVDTQNYLFPPSDFGCRGTTQWLSGVGTIFQHAPSPKRLTKKSMYHLKQGEDLQEYLLSPLAVAPGSLRGHFNSPKLIHFFTFYQSD